MKTLLLPLLLTLGLAACASGGEENAQGISRTIDVSRNADGTYQATAPTCPKWDDETLDRYANDPMPQLGCATAGNLSKMIADPADLVRAETKGGRKNMGDGAALSHGVTKYRSGRLLSTPAPTSTPQASGGGQ